MSDIAKELFNSIITNNATPEAFNNAISQKMEQELDVRRAGITADIYNKQVPTPETVVEESTDIEESAKNKVLAKDLEKLIKNPDPSRVKEYGGGTKYVDMLKSKLAKLQEDNTDLEEAKLDKPKGSPIEIQNQLDTLIAKAKTMKGISDDEYMSWYGNLDDKIYDKWDNMVKTDPQYKKAYKLGIQGGSDKPPFPKGSFAAIIWSNEYAAGAMDN